MERRTGRQEEMEPISKNSKVYRKPPNYAECRTCTESVHAWFGKGLREKD